MSYQDTVDRLTQNLRSQATREAADAVKAPSEKVTRRRVLEDYGGMRVLGRSYTTDNPNYDERMSTLDDRREAYVQENYGNRMAGLDFMSEHAEEYERMKADAEADREDILGELDAWRSGLNENFVDAGVAMERSQWDAKLSEVRNTLEQNAAAQGKVLSPWLQAEVLGRVTAQANSAVSLRRLELEQALRDRQMEFIQAKNNVYSNTDRQMIDPMQAYGLMQKLGAADAE